MIDFSIKTLKFFESSKYKINIKKLKFQHYTNKCLFKIMKYVTIFLLVEKSIVFMIFISFGFTKVI